MHLASNGWAGCEYKEYDSLLTEHFRNGLDEEGMINVISREVSALL